MKKILAILLSVLTVLSIFAVSASAMNVNVNIVTDGGRQIQIDVTPTNTVAEVKAIIAAQESVDVEKLTLTYNGTELADANDLTEYNIQQDSILELSIYQEPVKHDTLVEKFVQFLKTCIKTFTGILSKIFAPVPAEEQPSTPA